MASKATTKNTWWRAELLRIDPVEIYSLGSSPGKKISVFEELSKVVPFANTAKVLTPLHLSHKVCWLDHTDKPELKLFVFQIHISHLTGESPKATDDWAADIHPSSLLKLCQMKSMGS